MFLGRAIVKILFIAGNALVVILLLMTLLASVVSPNDMLLPAYTSLIFPITILLNVAFVVFWLSLRKWMALLSLAVLIFAAKEVAMTFPVNFGKSNTVVAENSVSLLTYNTHANDLMKKHKKNDPNKVIQYVLDKDPDIVCIQEYSANASKEHLTHEDLLQIFNKYPYKHIHYKNNSGSWSRFGVATFSKYPIIQKNTIKFESVNNSAIYSDINVNGKIFRLVNCHLESNKITEMDKVLAKELARDLKDNLDTKNFQGTTKILSGKLGAAYIARAAQADAVARNIRNSPYKVLVAGDFNDVPASYAYTKIKGNLMDAYEENGLGLGWTYNESVFRFRIDFILHDPGLEVTHFEREKVRYSDHFPLYCQINIK